MTHHRELLDTAIWAVSFYLLVLTPLIAVGASVYAIRRMW